MQKKILVLDDMRKFKDTNLIEFTHTETNIEALKAIKETKFDEIWIDWDLSSTDKKYQTSEPFLINLLKLDLKIQIKTITDMPDKAKEMVGILKSITPTPIITTIGAKWHANHFGDKWDQEDEKAFLIEAGVGNKEKIR